MTYVHRFFDICTYDDCSYAQQYICMYIHISDNTYLCMFVGYMYVCMSVQLHTYMYVPRHVC